MHARLFGAAIVAAALVFVGCGDDSSDKTLSKSEFVSQASAICDKVNADAKAATEAGDYDKVIAASDTAIAALNDLTPPEDMKDAFDTYLTAQTAYVEASKPIAEALTAGDQAKAEELAAAVEAEDAKNNELAKAAGLPACAS